MAAADAPTIQSVNKAMRSLIRELYMVGSYGTQQRAIEEAGYDRYSGLVPSDAIQTKATGIIIALYLEIDEEPTHTQLLGLIRDVISLNPVLVSSFNPAGIDLLARPEFADVVVRGPRARVDEPMRNAYLDAQAAYASRMTAAAPISAEDVEAEARAASGQPAWLARALRRNANEWSNNDADADAEDADADAEDADADADDAVAAGDYDKVIKIVASEDVAGAITESGDVYVWGAWKNNESSVYHPYGLADVKDLALSYDGAIAVKTDGSLVAWGGDNRTAEVVIPDGLRLKAVYGSEGGFYGIGLDNKIVYLPTIHNTVAVALPDIEVKKLVICENYAWGVAIGLDDSAVAFGPSAIAIPTAIKIKTAVLGRDFGLAILTNNTLYAWGSKNLNSVTRDNLNVLDVTFGATSIWVLKDTGRVSQYNTDNGAIFQHDKRGVTALAGSTDHVLMLDRAGRVSIYNPHFKVFLTVPYEIRYIEGSNGDANATPRNDSALYYDRIEQIQHALEVMQPSFDRVEAEIVPKVDGDIFDFSDGEAYESVADYLLEAGGEACLFLYNDHLMAFSKRQLAEKIESGDVVFYECRQVFPFDPAHGLFGTFEPTDIKKEKYVEIAMNGRFTFPIEIIRQLFTSHILWRIEDTPNVLPVTASWKMALHGGPVQSAVHCQNGTEKRLYKLTPVKFARREAAAAEAAVAAVVKIRRGENVRDIDLASGANVASVKGRYATAVGVNADRVRFIFGGKILKNTDVVTPGSMLQATVRAEGGTRRYGSRSKRETRKLSRR